MPAIAEKNQPAISFLLSPPLGFAPPPLLTLQFPLRTVVNHSTIPTCSEVPLSFFPLSLKKNGVRKMRKRDENLG
jgi:hypothetical protein